MDTQNLYCSGSGVMILQWCQGALFKCTLGTHVLFFFLLYSGREGKTTPKASLSYKY